MDPKSLTKLKRMAKYHPEVILRVIGRDWFKANQGIAYLIPDWEPMRA